MNSQRHCMVEKLAMSFMKRDNHVIDIQTVTRNNVAFQTRYKYSSAGRSLIRVLSLFFDSVR